MEDKTVLVCCICHSDRRQVLTSVKYSCVLGLMSHTFRILRNANDNYHHLAACTMEIKIFLCFVLK